MHTSQRKNILRQKEVKKVNNEILSVVILDHFKGGAGRGVNQNKKCWKVFGLMFSETKMPGCTSL